MMEAAPKKVLLVATVQCHICQFHRPLARVLHQLGYEVHVAACDNLAQKDGMQLDFADRVFDIPFARSPLSLTNIKAYRMLKRLIDEQGYQIVHCNTPVGGVLARLACRKLRKKGMRVLYTAHGFHFYKGAPILNWMLYYPIEWLCAHWTDRLITITDEDEVLARAKFKTEVKRIHSVGADSGKFFPISSEKKAELRKQYGVEPDTAAILCVAELNKNKNQKTAISAMAQVVKECPNAVLYLAGNGSEKETLQTQIRDLQLTDHVKLLGYTTKVADWFGISDIVVACSLREGLGMNVIEGMLCQKPVVASSNRGHRELVANGETGYLVAPEDADAFALRLIALLQSQELAKAMGLAGQKRAEKYTDINVERELMEIYRGL